ncbi:MAG: type VI secretion protein [Actinomycetota bacterium]|nr:type VI secretion protein [Actinomycetota bacterium]MDQ3430823.1 type VI secretion protein [Actinomycetota bacterium]
MAARERRDAHRQQGGVPDGLILGVLGFLLAMTCLVWTATGLAGFFARDGWPSGVRFGQTPAAMRHLVAQPHDITGAWPGTPAGELPGYGLFWGIFISQLMVLFVMTVFLIGVTTRYRLVRAARREAATAAGEQRSAAHSPPVAAVPAHAPAQAPVTAPGEAVPPPTPAPAEPAQSATAAEAPYGPLAGGELTRSHLAFVPHRSDKGKRLVQPAILNAAGPALVTTADPDTYHQTVGNRSKHGPVFLYDPTRLIDTPDRLRWAPHSGCEEAATAAARARALLHPLRPHATLDGPMFATAETLLRCWLHAAAVDGLPFRQVGRWSAGGAQEAVRILRTSSGAAPGWSGELESSLHAHPDRRDVAQSLIQRALESLNSVHLRDACNPGRNETFDAESFIADRGTLYVVGQPIEDPRAHPGAMPLLTALVSSVVEHGRRMAARSSSGRLDPPMSFVLDDIATLAPIPCLPDLISDGTAAGLPTLAVLRSQEQARDHWPHSLG